MASTGEKEPILLLKTKSSPTDAYEDLFLTPWNGLQLEPIFVPVLTHRFDEDGLAMIRQLLQEARISREPGADYGGIIFTSQRAVEAFTSLVEEGQKETNDPSYPHLHHVPIYSVGPATTRALRAVPQHPPLQVFGEHTGSGEMLAPFIRAHYGEWYGSAQVPRPPLLFLVGEKRRDIIPKVLMNPTLSEAERIGVDEVVVYGTGTRVEFAEELDAVLERTTKRRRRWVVVFSPTGCREMLKALGVLDLVGAKIRDRENADGQEAGEKSRDLVVAIGPTTRDHMRHTLGFDADVCAEAPSPQGVQEGIRRFLENEKENG